ncbi:alpha/beta fold hydrolase [Pseudomonas aeruginosa]|nr:alpha/beta fold hydrolase [Pseudomonas aeruginosa]
MLVALDLPGFGDSSKPQQASYDVGTQAERVANFAAAIGVRRLHLAGNSMGGHIAALYAARHPEQVLSLALIDNAGVMPARKSELFEDLERGENPLVVRQPEDFQKLLDFVFVQQPPLPAPLKRYLGERAVVPRRRSTRRYSNNCASATSRWSRNCRRSRHRPCCCGATATACWTSPASR